MEETHFEKEYIKYKYCACLSSRVVPCSSNLFSGGYSGSDLSNSSFSGILIQPLLYQNILHDYKREVVSQGLDVIELIHVQQRMAA